MEQLSLFALDEPDPFDCQHERSVADIGGGKTLCALMGVWTNCREVGRCTARSARRAVRLPGAEDEWTG